MATKKRSPAEDSTLTPRDARIAANRIDTIETLHAAMDDPPARSSRRARRPTGYKTALE